MAQGFFDLGWHISGCATDAVALRDLSDELGDDSHLEQCDVTQPLDVEACAKRVNQRFGPPDLLLNNAAIISPNAPLWEVTHEDFSRVMDVNLKGVHSVIRAFLPVMIQRGRGVVVNFSSGWGRSTSPEVAAYCATKWGIEGLTSALAQELPHGLAAVSLNPGVIDTQMLRSCFGDEASFYLPPHEWARSAVPFLVALDARSNGQALTVPGQ